MHLAPTSQTGQTERQDRQRSDSIGRTVLRTVAQKSFVGRAPSGPARSLGRSPGTLSELRGLLGGGEGREGKEGKGGEKERNGYIPGKKILG